MRQGVDRPDSLTDQVCQQLGRISSGLSTFSAAISFKLLARPNL